MISDKLRPVIQTKHRVLLLKVVAMLHENSRPHCWKLHQLKLKVLKHSMYSSHLASSDYRLLDPLKEAFRDRHFASDQKVNG
jgi:hypothetical protein